MSAEDGIAQEDTTFPYPWTAPQMDVDVLTTNLEEQIMSIDHNDGDMRKKDPCPIPQVCI